MNDDYVTKLITNRGNKAIAMILSAKEDLCDPHISDEAASVVRKVVLDQVNELIELALDSVADARQVGEVVYNDEYMRRKLDAIYEAVSGG